MEKKTIAGLIVIVAVVVLVFAGFSTIGCLSYLLAGMIGVVAGALLRRSVEFIAEKRKNIKSNEEAD